LREIGISDISPSAMQWILAHLARSMPPSPSSVRFCSRSGRACKAGGGDHDSSRTDLATENIPIVALLLSVAPQPIPAQKNAPGKKDAPAKKRQFEQEEGRREL